jgi:hypothetical protein
MGNVKAVWAWAAPGMPYGGRLLGEAPDRPTHSWIELCIAGAHLPQIYANDEITLLSTTACERLGLCPECLGFGDLAPTDLDSPDMAAFARGIDELTTPCPTCEGSGRSCIRATIDRSDAMMSGTIECIPHAYLPPPANRGMYTGMASAFGATEELCMACGCAPNGRWLGWKEVHIKQPEESKEAVKS